MIAGAAGSEDYTGPSADPLKKLLAGFGSRALRTALRGRSPGQVKPGEYTVILDPRATAELVEFLGHLGFASQAHVEGRSCLSGRLGTRVVGENITLRDDGLDPAGQPMPFDFEGAPRRALTLIENGVARELPHSSATARRMKAEPTGHSLGPASPHGGMPMHLVMKPGTASLEEMIASTGKGLYVSRFWYTNVSDPARAVITGMTRDGLFRITNGKLGRPVCNMRFTQSVLEALSRVDMIGSELVSVGADWGGGVTRVPALRIAGFRFTGATEF
jgi:predicted Zn-dependent protease